MAKFLRGTTVFVMTFLMLTVLGYALEEKWGLKLLSRSAENPPSNVPSDSWMGAYLPCSREALDYYYFYYDLGPFIENARKANILFIGNSRIQHAFPADVLAAYRQKTGKKPFNMGFGNIESMPFPLNLLRKYDLKPPIVVVNGDGFFNHAPSPWVKEVERIGKTRAQMKLWECEISFSIGQKLNRVYPSFMAGRHDSYVLRNVIYGSWFTGNWEPDQKIAVVPNKPKEAEFGDATKIAEDFKREVESKGSKLILTWIPTNIPINGRDQIQELARKMGVRFISPELANLTLLEGNHLSPESAKRFSAAFFEMLEKENKPQ
jgi:hypothetical protein